MAIYTIYHNPRCSKSRQTLELLNQQGVEVEIIDYLKTPPSKAELKKTLKVLGLKARDIMRKSEDEYKISGLQDKSLTESQQIDLMIANPKVIERPIVISGDKAIVGRPPENVLKLFK